MALLAASRIQNLIAFALQALGPLPSSSYSVKVINQAGQDWKTVSADEAIALAAKNQVVGKGSETRLKYLQLTDGTLEAQMTIDETKAPPTSRKKVFSLDIPIAEANFTIKHVNEPTGQYFEHRNEICATYGR